MSYSYYTPTQSLETLLDDVPSCSDSNVYRASDTAAAVDSLLHSASTKFIDSRSNPSVQTFSALPGNRAARTGTIIGEVELILPLHTLKHRNGRPGFVQSFIVVDSYAQRLNRCVEVQICCAERTSKKLKCRIELYLPNQPLQDETCER